LVDAVGSGPTEGNLVGVRVSPSAQIKKLMVQKNVLKIIPLGGLEEIGRNMILLEYQEKILILDMGLQFPTEAMPGVDYIIPNVAYLKGKEKNILGVFISHGHYDHIGAIPYLIGEIGNPPIFATSLTKGIIIARQKEFQKAPHLNVIQIKRRDEIKLPPFTIYSFPQTHNIPDGVGFFIKTPVGNVIYTGDFKFDHTPVGDHPSDIPYLSKLASKGVLVLMSDSTNAEVPGHSLSEKEIQENLEIIFEKSQGRIIAATFASLLSRIQELINLAKKFGRKVAIEGRAMRNYVEIAIKLGFIQIDPQDLIMPQDVRKFPDKEILIICTGSQGEDDAVLMRLAHKEHRFLSIKRGDTIILSSSIIPGNERAVQELKDLLSWQGAKIYHNQMMDIHASGHAQEEELKTMINITRPKFFVPVHGTHYMLELHKGIAMEMGIPEENIIVGENGRVIEVTKNKILLSKEKVPAGYVMVDGLGIGDVGEIVLRDRQAMAKDGMFVIVLVVDSVTGKVKQSPDIISRGFVYLRNSQTLLRQTRERAIRIVEKITQAGKPVNWLFVKNKLKEGLGEFLFEKTRRRPMVLPVVIEV
jgi:ribonuclease J